MASISTDGKGNRRIFFSGPNRKRKIIHLGSVPMKTARTIKAHVEGLAAALLAGHAPDPETSEWVGSRDAVLYGKLAAVGLAPKREPHPDTLPEGITLAAFIDQYVTARMIQKPNTLKNYQATRRALLDFFGMERRLASINAGDCDDWRSNLVGKGLASATIGRTVKRAKQFFRAAVRKKLIDENPMQDLKAASQENKSREFYVTADQTEKIIAACPDVEWRLIVALARYGGLRTPSETFALTLDCVDWELGRIRIPSPKTEYHAGREARTIPLFPELRPYLEYAFDNAEPGSTYFISRHRLASSNLRTQLQRIMNRAGVDPWPRLFQNMRASRETELCRKHPLHVVTSWIGNSAPIAARHYLQVTDLDFAAALERDAPMTQNPTQQPTAHSGKMGQETTQALGNQGLVPASSNVCNCVQTSTVPPRGVGSRFRKLLYAKYLRKFRNMKVAPKVAS
jgi:integrase